VPLIDPEVALDTSLDVAHLLFRESVLPPVAAEHQLQPLNLKPRLENPEVLVLSPRLPMGV